MGQPGICFGRTHSLKYLVEAATGSVTELPWKLLCPAPANGITMETCVTADMEQRMGNCSKKSPSPTLPLQETGKAHLEHRAERGLPALKPET